LGFRSKGQKTLVPTGYSHHGLQISIFVFFNHQPSSLSPNGGRKRENGGKRERERERERKSGRG
jgi:hypothetical protein